MSVSADCVHTILANLAPVVTVEAEAGAVANTGMETAYLTGTVSTLYPYFFCSSISLLLAM